MNLGVVHVWSSRRLLPPFPSTLISVSHSQKHNETLFYALQDFVEDHPTINWVGEWYEPLATLTL
jgi:hypothetical protein